MDWNLKGGGKRYCFLSYHLEVKKLLNNNALKLLIDESNLVMAVVDT